jgi:hypothetical protein
VAVVCLYCGKETEPVRRRRTSADPYNPEQRGLSFAFSCGACSAILPETTAVVFKESDEKHVPLLDLSHLVASARTPASLSDRTEFSSVELIARVRARAEESAERVRRLEQELARAREEAELFRRMAEIVPPSPPVAAE